MLEGLILGLHLMSYHASPGFNNVNPGVYAKFENGATVGAYLNSENHQSYYAGWTFKLHDRVDVTAGVVTGYSTTKYAPMLIPSVKVLEFEDSRVRVAFIPKVPNVNPSALLHFTIEKSF